MHWCTLVQGSGYFNFHNRRLIQRHPPGYGDTYDYDYRPKACPGGYRPDDHGGCIDDDECRKTPLILCGPNADCINTKGSFFCKCLRGYRKNEHGRCVEKQFGYGYPDHPPTGYPTHNSYEGPHDGYAPHPGGYPPESAYPTDPHSSGSNYPPQQQYPPVPRYPN
nr:hypothetical protein BaRGS_024128 [Batillaria attramentaria]